MLFYKDSVMAKKDNTGVMTDYYKDEAIGMISIEQVLLCLKCNNYGFKGMPTKEQLKKALAEIKKEALETISEDFDFYAREVIPLFLYEDD
jgi:hypothetical protein